MNIRQTLNDIYIEYKNNYLTVEKFAEHNLMPVDQASKLISIGWSINIDGVNFEHNPQAMVY